MKLCTFTHDMLTRIGLAREDGIVDLYQLAPDLPRDMAALLRADSRTWSFLREEAATARAHFAFDQVRFEAPVPTPGKVLGIGLNYMDHIRETGREPPKHQLWFNKQRTCIVGYGEAIRIPSVSDQVDYEGELVVVIGRRCRNVPLSRAYEVIAGYTVGNDVSTRDWQARTPTMTLGKSFDTHGPTGPWIVTPDEIADPHALSLRTWVNDELRQDASTAEMLFTIPEQIAHVTQVFTLEPGDLIFTGTPAGVGLATDPPGFVKAGDVVRIEIEAIGRLENPVINDDTGIVIV